MAAKKNPKKLVFPYRLAFLDFFVVYMIIFFLTLFYIFVLLLIPNMKTKNTM